MVTESQSLRKQGVHPAGDFSGADSPGQGGI